MKVSILIYDNFTDLDLFMHWDLLGRVKSIAGVADWQVKIVGTKPTHLSAHGLAVPTTGTFADLRDSDGVIFCSGKGSRPLVADAAYLAALGVDPAQQLLGAQCSGSLFLGALGLLKGKRVSAYGPILAELRNFEPELVEESLVVDGAIATASSCLAGQYLSRWMIQRLAGRTVAERVMAAVEPLGGPPNKKYFES